MKFPPTYTTTPSIRQLLYELDVLKTSYELRPVTRERAVHLRRASLLKSSLYSARIEGNPLEWTDMTHIHEGDDDRHKIEVSNLVSAYEQLPNLVGQDISTDALKKLHARVLYTLAVNAGSFRYEESAIYNQAGIAVYLTPAPQDVRGLMDELCVYVNTTKDASPIAAGVSHIWFEKIHPFLDGNGRVGRLLSAHILQKGTYDFGGLVPFEQYLDEHRDDYYHFLGIDRQDVTEFVEFYLTALLSQAKASLKAAHELGTLDTYDYLLPRRAEIMRVLEDHKIISFDFLARRFRAVPTRTLHNDVSQLIKVGLIQKMGSTRGVVYTAKVKQYLSKS